MTGWLSAGLGTAVQITFEQDGVLGTDGRRRPWLAPPIITGLMRAVDLLVVATTGLMANYARFEGFVPEPLAAYAMALAALLSLNLFQIAGLYTFSNLGNLFIQATRLGFAWGGVAIAMLLLGFATKTLQDFSILWVGSWFVLGYVGLLATRVSLIFQLQSWQQSGKLVRRIIVLGGGDHGRRFAEHLQRCDGSVKLMGIFDDRAERVPELVAGVPVRGTIDDVRAFVRDNWVDQIVIALPWGAEERLLSWVKKIRDLPVDVRLCPDVIGYHLPDRKVSHVAGLPLLNVFERPLDGWDGVVKAVEDRLLATLMLLALSPLMLMVAAAIRLTSKGPILFRQKRYGFNNEIIDVYKFRSMYIHACEDGASPLNQASRNDPRVTPVGRIIRRTSLDELPQLFNVLNGTMSIVGPRPHAVAHNEHYARLIDEYLARHKVKPGITGWAQVNGLRGETETLEKMQQRVQYDLHYIENWSLGFDIKIVMLTALVGFTDRNAY